MLLLRNVIISFAKGCVDGVKYVSKILSLPIWFAWIFCVCMIPLNIICSVIWYVTDRNSMVDEITRILEEEA